MHDGRAGEVYVLNIAGQKVVLAVDDDPDTLRLVARFPQQAGYAVLEARSAVEARGLLSSRGRLIDLVLLDIQLPGEPDGIELAGEIRSRPEWARVPIVALTASSLRAGDGSLLDFGFTAYVPKPFTERQLVSAVSVLAPPGC